LLEAISKRVKQDRIELQDEEIKLVNLLRIVVDGGWLVD
jgi:hypothetical protein